MKVTQVEELQASMVEIDHDSRYLRLYIPSAGYVEWFQPTGMIDELQGFVLVDPDADSQDPNTALERAWKEQQL